MKTSINERMETVKKLPMILFVVVIAGILASSASAAVILQYDLRNSSGGKTVSVSAVGQEVTLSLYAMVYNGDGNANNDGFCAASGGITSAGALKGDLQDVVLQVPFNTFTGTGVGLHVDLDADTDLDVGQVSTGTTVSDFINAISGATSDYTYDVTEGDWQVWHIVDVTFKVNSGAAADQSTDVNFQARNGTSIDKPQKLNMDGTYYKFKGNDTANVGIGAPVVITFIPEPATMALLALGGVATLLRKRK